MNVTADKPQEKPIVAGDKVVGTSKDGKLIVGVVVHINKGWATIDNGETPQPKIRTSELDHFEDKQDKEPVGGSSGMSRKLAAARKQYVKDGRTFHNGDPIARALHGRSLNDTYNIAHVILGDTLEVLRGKYQHLNPGQQRMNLGNRIRRAITANPTLLNLITPATPIPQDEPEHATADAS